MQVLPVAVTGTIPAVVSPRPSDEQPGRRSARAPRGSQRLAAVLAASLTAHARCHLAAPRGTPRHLPPGGGRLARPHGAVSGARPATWCRRPAGRGRRGRFSDRRSSGAGVSRAPARPSPRRSPDRRPHACGRPPGDAPSPRPLGRSALRPGAGRKRRPAAPPPLRPARPAAPTFRPDDMLLPGGRPAPAYQSVARRRLARHSYDPQGASSSTDQFDRAASPFGGVALARHVRLQRATGVRRGRPASFYARRPVRPG